MRRRATAAAIVGLTALYGGVHLLSHSHAEAATVRTVVLKNVEFNPASVTIRRGGSVRWVWRDGSSSHDVTSRGTRRFKSSTTQRSGTHTVRFRRAGTYRYVCTIHPNMRGRVVVR
ncbi:MAG TPA: cupredoxin domain-containing protein [Solirubrobacteraceae bacterium]|nr:cupredoxin domain-containing protein [Solirubrobacteraceae bacterium]